MIPFPRVVASTVRHPHTLLRSMALLTSSFQRVSAPEKLQIQLTEVENNICDLLRECTAFLHQEKGVKTTCRIAGGWVRDKLLGLQSNDMDVALSDMMGLAFAEHLSQFASSKGVKLGTITKIEQNPDQSKHLETATLKIFGLDIDLVNLRSEEYAVGSRIPTGVAFGTPLEDALRRDITINALFYNVETRMVEDFTKKGLNDLRAGIIRTPMPPMETFLDDPLRVLRCIRFASRFGFEVVPEIKEAVRNRSVQEALVSKVARERVGDEVGKMIKGRDPIHSARLICELSLYHSIFSVIPSEAKSAVTDVLLKQDFPDDALRSITILHSLLSPAETLHNQVHPVLLSGTKDDPSSMTRILLASLLTPYINMVYKDGKNKVHPLVTSVIRDSLKLGTQNYFLNGIPTLFSSITVITDHMENHSRQPLSRVQLGLLLRHKSVHNPTTGNHWTTSFLLSLVAQLRPFYDVHNDVFNVDAASKIFSLFNAFVDTIIDLGLQYDVDSKPLLNGREVGAIFGVTKTGPWIGKVLEDVVKWQLGHPKSSKNECSQWLKSIGPDSYITKTDDDNDKAKISSKRLRTK